MNDAYHIKPGYQENRVQATLDTGEGGEYWNAERRESARRYQYYVYEYASRALAARSRAAVMDVGCGYPWKFRHLLAGHAAESVLVDQPSTAGLVRELCPEARFVAADLETIDVEIGRLFDVIVCADVVEHLVDPDPCLSFIRRHLRPDGVAVFSTPERDHLRGVECDHCPKREHVREWNEAEFLTFLGSRGFEVAEQVLYPQQRLPAWEQAIYRRLGAGRWPRRWGSCQMTVAKASVGYSTEVRPVGPA